MEQRQDSVFWSSPLIREMVAMALDLSQKFTNGLVNELNAKCSEAGKQWVRKDLMCSHCAEHWGHSRVFLGLALWMAMFPFPAGGDKRRPSQ